MIIRGRCCVHGCDRRRQTIRWGVLHPEGACNAPLRGDGCDDAVDGVGPDLDRTHPVATIAIRLR
jgi:hypothetical protein